jgi:hypothetical protein
MKYVPDFLQGATNVYRTRNYIVKQCVCIKYDCAENNGVVSYDTFYRRNPKRDAEYEILFSHRKHVDGKRLPTTMYARTYIDEPSLG